MFTNRLDNEVQYPRKYISPELQGLLELMLERDPAKRVKVTQIDKLKKNAWCKSLDWAKVLGKEYEPPFKPNIRKSNFDPEYVRDASVAGLANMTQTS